MLTMCVLCERPRGRAKRGVKGNLPLQYRRDVSSVSLVSVAILDVRYLLLCAVPSCGWSRRMWLPCSAEV